MQHKNSAISFLSNLLKDRPYVLLSYMTGILPIAKYSSGSELNMFLEYTMASEERFSADFGFTESETDLLYDRYTNCTKNPQITREGLRFWYDGYQTKSGEKLYNPRSVVAALSNNNLGNYWTSSGPYDEIYYYIENNIDDVRTDLALMVSGEKVPAKIREYAATSMNLSTRDEIFSAMVVYGFLSYADGQICIPNKELMDILAVGIGYDKETKKHECKVMKLKIPCMDKENVVFFLSRRLLAAKVKYHIFVSYIKVIKVIFMTLFRYVSDKSLSH